MSIIGIDVGGTKIAVSIGSKEGTIYESARIPTRECNSPFKAIDRIYDIAREMRESCSTKVPELEAVGVGVPGPCSIAEGKMLQAPNMKGWDGFPIVKTLQEKFNCPVYMNNDANACALAEYMYGEFRDTDNMIYLTASTGMGGGIIMNGHLLVGATVTGGEVGHHILDIHGPRCNCGLPGCFEVYCGGKSVAKRLRDQIETNHISTAILDYAGGDPDQIDFKTFTDAVRAEDSFALEQWEEFTERLAQGVGNLIMIFNPDVIIFGTFVIKQGDLIMEPLRRKLPQYTWKAPREACRLVASSLGNRIGELSSIALAAYALKE